MTTDLQLGLGAKLWDLIVRLERADKEARREEMRQVLQRRLYYKGEQYVWWNERQGVYHPLYESPDRSSYQNDEGQSFMHVTNIFKAFTQSLLAPLSQNQVPAQFWPQDPRDAQDLITAKNAKKVVELVHRNNRMSTLATRAAWLGLIDGFTGVWTRYVTDGSRFGFDEVPVMVQGQSELQPATWVCESCSQEYAEDASWGVCPDCGGQLVEQAPIMGDVPIPQGTERVPRGQEIMSVYGALNIRRTMTAQDQSEFLYLDLVMDANRASVMKTYPEAQLKVKQTDGLVDPGEDTYEETARRILTHGWLQGGTRSSEDQGTLHHIWLRPATYLLCDDETRQVLEQNFPDGLRMVFFGDVLCDVRNESMDEAWSTKNSEQGEGQLNDAPMGIMVSAQDQLNDLTNMMFEVCMHGVPETFFRDDAINMEARNEQQALPGSASPVSVRSGMSVGDEIYTTPAVEPSQALVLLRAAMFSEIPQFLTGAFPALFGAAIGKTAAEYEMAREQALGRLGPLWREHQDMWSKADLNAVQCFAKHRTEDMAVPVIGKGEDFKAEMLQLADLRGNITAYVEVDQQYPVMQSQIRGVIESLREDPIMQMLMTDPENLSYRLSRLGLTELRVPGDDSRVKQLREIEQLLQAMPMPSGQVDPDTGEPVLLPSIAPDSFADNHQVELETWKKWANSEEGINARYENPVGFENSRLHAMAHEQIMKAMQLAQAVAETELPTATAVDDQDPASRGEDTPAQME